MQTVIKVGDVVIRVGDKLCANNSARKMGICDEGEIVTVAHIPDDGIIGICSKRQINGWGSCDGRTPKGKGFWASRDCIHDHFYLVHSEYIINTDIVHKRRNLNGMKCTLIKNHGDGELSFIELNEDVGGGGADGLGKAGHCVLVPFKSLNKVDCKNKKLKFSKGKGG